MKKGKRLVPGHFIGTRKKVDGSRIRQEAVDSKELQLGWDFPVINLLPRHVLYTPFHFQVVANRTKINESMPLRQAMKALKGS